MLLFGTLEEIEADVKAKAGVLSPSTADPQSAGVEDLQMLVVYLCKNGFEHHVALTRDHRADVLHEAITTYLGWDLYYHNR